MPTKTLPILIVLTTSIVMSTISTETCHRPEELKDKEEACWKSEIEVVDRFVQTSKSVFNLAKKKLGIAVEEENDTKKCQYYICILHQLHMLNAHDYPGYESIKQWTERNVVYFQALDLMERLNKCNDALTNATLEERIFLASEVESTDPINTETDKNKQSTCEIATEFIDCLSRQKECPVFNFP